MEQNFNTTNFNTNRPQEDLPNATAILVLGIISIVLTGLIGAILAIIALSMGSSSKKLYENNPDQYTDASYSKVKAGRVCAIVSLCLLGLVILIAVLVIGVGLNLR